MYLNHGALLLVRSDDVRLSYAAYLLRSRYLDRTIIEECIDEARSAHASMEDILLENGYVDEDTVIRQKTELGMDILERLYAEPAIKVGWAETDPAPTDLDVRPVLYLAAFFKAVRNRAASEDLTPFLQGREDFRLHPSELRSGFFELFDRVFHCGNPPPYLDGGLQVGELLGDIDGDEFLRQVFALTRLRMAWFHRSDPPDVDPAVSLRIWEEVFAELGQATV